MIEGLSTTAFLREISTRLHEAAAVASAALAAAEGGAEREAFGIAFDLDQFILEVGVLHGAMVATKRLRPSQGTR